MIRRAMMMLSVPVLFLTLCGTASALTYEVEIRNLIGGGLDTGQPFSPPVAVVHGGLFALWEPGALASEGVRLVAREGDPSLLQFEISGASDVYATHTGIGPFFDPQIFTIEGSPGDLFSVVWMLGRTNDLISGLHDIPLPEYGTPVELNTDAWDAGCEENTGLIVDIPFYGNHNVGPNENNPISMISTYVIYDDPDFGELTWNFPPVGSVRIEALPPTPAEQVTWGEIKALY